MSLTNFDTFINDFCVEDGMIANAENINHAPIQLKKEIDEINNKLVNTQNSAQVLDATDAISATGKTVTIKKGDGTIESISLDLFDTKVDRIQSVDNRIPKFSGTNGDLQLSSATIDSSGNLVVNGNITSSTGNLGGNASSASKLQTARTLGGVLFDGTANISLPGVNITGNQSTTGNAATATAAQNSSFFTSGAGTENQIGVTLNGQPSVYLYNNANTWGVYSAAGGAAFQYTRSSSKFNFNGNADTATTTTGNAATATKLQTARNITLGGVISGVASFDGTANVNITASANISPTITLSGGVTGSGTMSNLGSVTINAVVTNDSHTHDTRYYTISQSNTNFLNKTTGGAITGDVSVSGNITANVVAADGGLTQDGFTILNGSDTWLRTNGSTGWYNATYSGGMYMTDSTWVRTYNSKGLLTDGSIYSGSDAYIGGTLVVGNGKTSSLINMNDSDEGTRQIHCNSNRIGFLNQAGSWGSYCNDDGSFTSDFSFSSPNFYGGRFTGTGNGNDYSSGGIETRGNGSANTIFPTIGFHQPNAYASSLQLRSAGEFYFYTQGTGSYANVTANLFRGTATSAYYADLAEKYLSDKEYEIGTVCEVGGEKEITLYNGGPLAGVISENPGFRLNEESEGQFIALKGKIPVKCEGEVKKAQYCIAIPGGKVKGVDYFDSNFTLKIVGVALEDSKDGLVMVKV